MYNLRSMDSKIITLRKSTLVAIFAVIPPFLYVMLWLVSINIVYGQKEALELFVKLQLFSFTILSVIAVVSAILALVGSKRKAGLVFLLVVSILLLLLLLLWQL